MKTVVAWTVEANLKSCPFCGGKAVMRFVKHNCKYHVICESCEVHTLDLPSKPEAARVWNCRIQKQSGSSVRMEGGFSEDGI